VTGSIRWLSLEATFMGNIHDDLQSAAEFDVGATSGISGIARRAGVHGNCAAAGARDEGRPRRSRKSS